MYPANIRIKMKILSAKKQLIFAESKYRKEILLIECITSLLFLYSINASFRLIDKALATPSP